MEVNECTETDRCGLSIEVDYLENGLGMSGYRDAAFIEFLNPIYLCWYNAVIVNGNF